jgi:hypothetical protein
MGKIPNVLHPIVKPISVYEFYDAIQATARPQFKNVRLKERKVGKY